MASSEVSQHINIKEFIAKFAPLLPRVSYTLDPHEYVEEEMNPSDEIMQDLLNVCGFHTLRDEDIPELLTTFPENCTLAAVNLQKSEVEKREKSTVYNQKIRNQMHYRFDDSPYKHEILCKSTESGHIVSDVPDALISIRIFKPYIGRGKPNADQEFQVLGSNLLSGFIDKIRCLNNSAVLGDFSDCPDVPPAMLSKDMFKSQYFFIEGTFYNDLRHMGCTDMSKDVVAWAKQRNRSMGQFESKNIVGVRFDHLTVRVGQPYIYVHQGECEHFMVITDIRMLHPDECQDENRYPLLVGHSQVKKLNCRVCMIHTALWLTRDSQISPEDPCFFCETCFKALHYDKDGRKLKDFKAYPLLWDHMV